MTPEPPSISRKLAHQAFKRLHDAHSLGDHPLAALEIVTARLGEAGYADTASGRSLALRAVLREAVLALRPEGEEDFQDRRWRQFIILSERYLNRRTPDSIADRLGIARSTYDHDHADALDEIAAILQRKQDELHTTKAPVRQSFFSLAPPLPPQAVVGRQTELAQLKAVLAGPATVCAIVGLPGIGKTTIAVALAHDPETAASFDGGVLWAGLGQSPDLANVLTTWGLALGLRLDEMSHLSEDALARALRAIIGMRRILFVLDDVWSQGDATAIILGGPNCRTLITTRLPGIAIDLAGDHTLHLGEFGPAETRALLAGLVPEIIAADPTTVELLHEAAGGLPMTLNLMGRHLRRESRVSGSARRLGQSLEKLLKPDARLQLAEPVSLIDGPAGTPRSLMGVIALSVDQLDEAPAGALLALSLLPPKPNTFSEPAALSISAAADDTLDALVDSGLITAAEPGRYTIHRAISDYAKLRLDALPDARQSAALRIVTFFARESERIAAEQAVMPESEVENILASLDLAGDYAQPDVFIQMANQVYPSLEMRGLFARARRSLSRARQSAEETPGQPGMVALLNNLGRAAIREGNPAEAETFFRAGLAHTADGEDAEETIVRLTGLGIVALGQGSYDEAQRLLEEALARAQNAGHEPRISALLANLGTLELAQGNAPRARQLLGDALEAARGLGDRIQSGAVLANLGVLAAREHDYLSAETYFEESLALANQVGNRESMSSLLTNLGTLASERGDEAAARTYFEQAISLAREMGQQDRLCQLLANQSALAIRRGELAEARQMLDEGLAIAHSINHHEHMILLLANRGALSEAEGDLDDALAQFQSGLAQAEALGLARYVEALRQQIDRLGTGGPARLTA